MAKYSFKTLLPAAPVLAAALFLAQPARADHPVAREDVASGSHVQAPEPAFYDIVQHDLAMRGAVLKARRTVGVFIQALKAPRAGQHDFQVKKPFRQGTAVEHIWLADVTFSGNRFHGYVDNKPHKIKSLRMGDYVSVNPSEISDWAFVDNGRLRGGYTIRVIYHEMTPAERQKFDSQAVFRITNHP